MTSTEESLARAYLSIYLDAAEEFKLIPWWKFKKRERIKKRIRWSQYHYKKLTGKNMKH
jgi:hypothetical protein